MSRFLNIDRSTCWYSDKLYLKVNEYTENEPPLDKINHGIVLKNLLDLIPMDQESVIDIGCGNAKASIVVGERSYVGVDLPNNIEKIGMVNNPNLEFIKCDVLGEDIGFLESYDIVLMNAFIDVMQYPIRTLNKILKHCMRYLILHRQEIVDFDTQICMNPSYGGLTYHSMINRGEFLELLDGHRFEILYEVDGGFGGNWRSFVLKRKL